MWCAVPFSISKWPPATAKWPSHSFFRLVEFLHNQIVQIFSPGNTGILKKKANLFFGRCVERINEFLTIKLILWFPSIGISRIPFPAHLILSLSLPLADGYDTLDFIVFRGRRRNVGQRLIIFFLWKQKMFTSMFCRKNANTESKTDLTHFKGKFWLVHLPWMMCRFHSSSTLTCAWFKEYFTVKNTFFFISVAEI